MIEHTEIKTYSDDSSLKQTCSLCSEHTHVIGKSVGYTYKTEDVEQIKVRQSAGCWVISSSFYVNVKTKPNWLHRLITRLLLGWKWEDRK